MAGNEIDQERIKSTTKRFYGRMNRSNALLTMGAIAAGVPYIGRVISDLGKPGIWSMQDPDKELIDPLMIKAIMKVTAPGEFELRCRTVDANGIAQPLPRPFGLSGINRIEVARVITEPS
jgi:hypothetical protein